MPKFRIAKLKKKKKTRGLHKTTPTKGLIFFQAKLDFSNFEVFVEFSADEHGLNCGLDVRTEDCETFLHYNSRGLIFKWCDCINRIFALFIHFALRMPSR